MFIDDILIYSKTVEEHEDLVRWVLKSASAKRGTTPTLTSVSSSRGRCPSLVMSSTRSGLSVQQHKVKSVSEWPQPQTRKDVKSFLGPDRVLPQVRARGTVRSLCH